MNSQIGPRGKLLRFKHIKIMHGNFTFMFGYWADSVVHLPPLKSSMTIAIALSSYTYVTVGQKF